MYIMGAALWAPPAKAAPPVSAVDFRREVKSAALYRKPRGQRNGFDGNHMNQVMVVEKSPAIRVKLELAGKPQAAQLPDGTIVVAGFIEPPVHQESRCTLRYSRDNGKTFDEPRVLEMEGRSSGFRCLKDGTLILGHGGARQGISRSTDGGKTWSTFSIPADIVPGEKDLRLGECHGPIELPDGTLLVHLARTVGHYEWAAYVIRSNDG